MLKNYITTAFRNMIRHKVFSAINIFGLATGMATVIFIFLWVTHELSFDRFHENAQDIYRIEEDQYYNNERYHVTVTPWPSGPVWEAEIPEIKASTRFAFTGSLLFRYNDNTFYEEKVMGADSGFFKIFSFKLLEGNPQSVLSRPNSIVISNEIAEKYFGNENPVGKTFHINNKFLYEVTGVFEKVPDNSTLEFDMLISFDFMINNTWYSDHWGSNSIFTYVLLHPGSNAKTVNDKLTQVVNNHKEDNNIDFMVTLLTDIHLYGYFGFNHQPAGIQSVRIFSIVGIFILIIACINFMNLTTARSAGRSKEIGLRKVNGALRKNLILQFLSESMLITIISVVISILLVLLLLDTFNKISGKNFSPTDISNPLFVSGVIAITFITGFLAGTYPSIILSSLKPVNILKSKFGSTGKGWFRKISVTFQFILTIILIIGSVVIYRQLTYMQNKKLGYDKENLIYLPMRGELRNSYTEIKDRLVQAPVVLNITATAHPPHSIGSNSGGINWTGKDPDMTILVSQEGSDFDYVETMKINMKSGRSFSREFGSDAAKDTSASFIINEELEGIMNKEEIIGTQMHFMGFTGPVIGVMENYHYQSVRNSIEPLAIIVAPQSYLNFITIRLKSGNISENIKEVENAWNEIMPQYPFDFKFVDQEFDQMYRSEARMSDLMKYFTIIAIVIACVGLFGLSAFAAEQKTREIGIRKALGANIPSILILFSREFVWLLLISALISWPLSWFVLKNWLQNFGYRSELNIWIFIFSGLAALIIALISISYQAIKAARTNPAITLKYE